MTVSLAHPNGMAPVPTRGNKGNKGGRVAQAWQRAWDMMGDEFMNGRELADDLARRYDLSPATILTHLSIMAKEGHLDAETRTAVRPVSRTVNGRISTFDARVGVTFYRIASRPSDSR